MLVEVGKGERFATEAGLGGEGGGFASHLCKELYTIVQHALLPLNEVRRISVACGEFRPRRLKQNPTVVKQKSIISDAREGHF